MSWLSSLDTATCCLGTTLARILKPHLCVSGPLSHFPVSNKRLGLLSNCTLLLSSAHFLTLHKDYFKNLYFCQIPFHSSVSPILLRKLELSGGSLLWLPHQTYKPSCIYTPLFLLSFCSYKFLFLSKVTHCTLFGSHPSYKSLIMSHFCKHLKFSFFFF